MRCAKIFFPMLRIQYTKPVYSNRQNRQVSVHVKEHHHHQA